MGKTAKYFEDTGRKLWFKGDYYQALRLMREGLALYPGSFRLKLGIAMSQLRLGDFAAARDLLLSVLEQTPDNGDALTALVEAYLNLGRKKESLDAAKKVLKKFPHLSSLLEHLGMLFLSHGLFKESLLYLQKSAEKDLSRPYCHFGMGIAYSGLNNSASAIKEIKKALSLKKDFYEAMSYMGNILYDKGEKTKALRLFMRIPPAEHTDPLTINRLIDYSRNNPRYRKMSEPLQARLRVLMSSHDIGEFIKMLEDRSPESVPVPEKMMRLVFVKNVSQTALSSDQKVLLFRMDAYLKKIFGKPSKYAGFESFPEVKELDSSAVNGLLSDFGSYLQGLSDKAGTDRGVPLSKFSKSWGIDAITPYVCSVFQQLYKEDSDFLVSQHSIDVLIEDIVAVLKLIPPGLKGSEWIVELGGIITAFWTQADMLYRILLIKDILTPAGKKSIRPLISRGRAWRKWLGYRAEEEWSYPSSKILEGLQPEHKKVAAQPCAKCGREIKDFSQISRSGKPSAIQCGDCAPFFRCSECGGPMRQTDAGRKKSSKSTVYTCMECSRQYQVRIRSRKK